MIISLKCTLCMYSWRSTDRGLGSFRQTVICFFMYYICLVWAILDNCTIGI